MAVGEVGQGHGDDIEDGHGTNVDLHAEELRTRGCTCDDGDYDDAEAGTRRDSDVNEGLGRVSVGCSENVVRGSPATNAAPATLTVDAQTGTAAADGLMVPWTRDDDAIR